MKLTRGLILAWLVRYIDWYWYYSAKHGNIGVLERIVYCFFVDRVMSMSDDSVWEKSCLLHSGTLFF